MKNYRISELAAEAYGLCKKIDDEGRIVIRTDEYDQVFAKLIIKECIKACDGNHEYKNHTDTYFGRGIAEGIQLCKIQIADRFGVEE